MFLAPPFPGTFQVWRFELKKSICAKTNFYFTLETRNLPSLILLYNKSSGLFDQAHCKGTLIISNEKDKIKI